MVIVADPPGASRRAFPSEEWFARRFDRLRRVDTSAGSVTIEYVVESGASRYAHHQVFEAGRLVAWREGEHGDPDVRIVQPLAHARAFLEACGDPIGALEATRIVVVDDSGERRFAVPPLDERGAEALRSLPAIPGATVTLRLVLSHSPFGHVSFTQRFEDGQRVGFSIDGAQEPECDGVGVMTYEAYVRYRCGEVSLIEALEGTAPGGLWARLMLAAGLIDGPEYRAGLESEAAPHRARMALGTLGEIVSSPNYIAALVELESESVGS